MKKIIQSCVYQSEIYRIIFTGCSLQVCYSQIKRPKDVHPNNQYHNLYRCRDESPRRNAVKCLLFLVRLWDRDIENEIYAMNKECQLLFFRLRATSASENLSDLAEAK